MVWQREVILAHGCAPKLELLNLRDRSTKARLIIFRGMHNILETSMESRCNEAMRRCAQKSFGGAQARLADAWHGVLFRALCKTNTARHSIDRQGPTSGALYYC
jgi:hypothetical protein